MAPLILWRLNFIKRTWLTKKIDLFWMMLIAMPDMMIWLYGNKKIYEDMIIWWYDADDFVMTRKYDDLMTHWYDYIMRIWGYDDKGSWQKNPLFLGLCPKLWVGGGSRLLNFWWSFGFTCLYHILGNFEHYFPPWKSYTCAVGGWGPLFRTKS